MNTLAAIEENLEAFFPHLLQFSDVRYRQSPHIWWSITRIPYPLFNGVLHTRLPKNKVDSTISEIITTAGLCNVPVLWWLLPTARPSGIGKILESWGWQPQPPSPAMYRSLHDAAPPPQLPPGCRIVYVNNNDQLKDWCRITANGFSLPKKIAPVWENWYSRLGCRRHPHLRHYLLYYNNRAVSAATLFSSPLAAGFYNITTLPSHRSRGFGTLITQHLIRAAKQQGHHQAILFASPMGEPIYRKHGFQTNDDIIQYLWTP